MSQVPKIFISYSWSSDKHTERVQNWADRLVADGVEVIIDVYDLKEGHDKFAFMEGMVTDSAITHVLVICDKEYATKADQRKAGVGTETQIISKEVYGKVKQSKFIPIVCEFTEDGEAYLPTFLNTRIWLNFTSPEEVNKNWEKLIRLLYGKPAQLKPQIGQPPSYITQDTAGPSIPTRGKLSMLREGILQGKPAVRLYRSDFLQTCVRFLESTRRRSDSDSKDLTAAILSDYSVLKQIRDQIIDWVLLESSAGNFNDNSDELIDFLEQLLALKYRPNDVNQWSQWWFDAHVVFVYEIFLYIVAALLKNRDDSVLHDVFTTRYNLPDSASGQLNALPSPFTVFYGYSDLLNKRLSGDNLNYHSGTAELIRRNSDRSDIPFDSIKEAETISMLMYFLQKEESHHPFWHPGTLNYNSFGTVTPLFRRAVQKRGYKRLATITGIEDSAELVRKAKAGIDVSRKGGFESISISIVDQFNLQNLDSI